MQKFKISVSRVVTDIYEVMAMEVNEAYSLIHNGIDELGDYEKLATCYKKLDTEISDPKVSAIEFSIFDIEKD